MKRDRTYADYVEDIIEAIDKIETFIEDLTYPKFLEDHKTSFAVVRALEIIGEATKKIFAEVRNQYPDIPWRSMADMRDKLSHQYFGVNLEVVWKTSKEDLPQLRTKLKIVLEKIEKS